MLKKFFAQPPTQSKDLDDVRKRLKDAEKRITLVEKQVEVIRRTA